MTTDDSAKRSLDEKPLDKRLIIVLMIIFTEVLGFSIVLPVIPFLALALGLTPFYIGLIASIFSLCQLFSNPVFGKLSDRFGRKPILIISQSSTFVGFLLLGVATSVVLLVAARVVDGLFGSNMTVSQAYISDVTEPEQRTRVFGYSSAVFGAGLIFGPSIGGILSTVNFSLPMFFAAGISGLTILLVILFLPETVTEKPKGISLQFDDVIPINEVKRYSRDPRVRDALVVFLVYNLGFFLFISNFVLFAEIQLHVDALLVGYYQSWIGILRVFLQTFLIAFILKKIGEDTTFRVGSLTMVLSMLGLIIAYDYLFVYLPLTFLAFGTGVIRPILTSRLTNSVPQKESGTVLGVNSSLTSLGQIITPILGGAILETLPAIVLPTISAGLFFSILFLYRRRSA